MQHWAIRVPCSARIDGARQGVKTAGLILSDSPDIAAGQAASRVEARSSSRKNGTFAQ